MKASIIIPTYNAGALFKEVLDKVLKQDLNGESFEVIIVDSESTDGTYEYVQQVQKTHSNVILEKIDKKTFQHGRTRNHAASLGCGEFCVFITQDAMPYNDEWLFELLKPFKDEAVAGVFGRHVAYDTADVFEKKILDDHFNGFKQNDEGGVFVIDDYNKFMNDQSEQAYLSFYSDNSSAMRRSIWEKIPYPEVNFAEDQFWAKKILMYGYKKAYAHNSIVYHSHRYPFMEAMRRYAEDAQAIYNIYNIALESRVKSLPIQILRQWKADMKALRDMNLTIGSKLYNTFYSFKKNTSKIIGFYLGYRKQTMIDNQADIQQRWKRAILWTLIYGRKNLDKRNETVAKFAHEYVMIEPVEKNLNPKLLAQKTTKNIAWFIPDFGIGSGGHTTIFRTIEQLEKQGLKNDIYIIGGTQHKSSEKAKAIINQHFFKLDANVEIIKPVQLEGVVKYYDVTFATSWDTCYYVMGFAHTSKRAYFVQDFEPSFFATGSSYHLAENTYKMPFDFIVTAGDWLKAKMSGYGFEDVTSFGFAYDKEAYKPQERKDYQKRVVYYARPETERRGFEIALYALAKLKDHRPDVEVVLYGSNALGNYNIPFEYVNKGILSREECGALFAESDCVVVLSLTNLSLLPFEVAATETTLIMNRGENNSWIDPEEKYFVYCDAEHNSIYQAIIDTLNGNKVTEKVELAQIVKQISWENEINKTYQAIMRNIEEV
ncbi:MAG: glycosyltransferase [Culicoidibacterales bacterium]